jgi:Uma2 family endonuclease
MNLAGPPSPPRTISAEDLVAMPDDGVDREIVRGRLRERPATWRSLPHARTAAGVTYLLGNWLDQQPPPRGEVVSGGAGFRLRRDPDTFVGIDVAYAPPELVASTPPKSPFYEGPPALAVEILSPSDTHEDAVEKVELYHDAGAVVWVVDPEFRTVAVHRPGAVAETLNVNQDLSGDPYLPGFRARVADLFG